MMTQFDFQLLPPTEQLDLLYSDGVYIGKRKEANRTVLLYQLDAFYVEVFYAKHRCFYTGIRCFRSTVLLDPYLESIDVEHLV
ncbi:MAG: hypothetical protein JWP27_632 [Flaviaesturariibacter sp.]|nr:hypothetical protein [Flaviaesturariibacter sp.]